ncbi:MAG: hypothetical protein ABIK13_01570 [Patescibacteria group bacterium]
MRVRAANPGIFGEAFVPLLSAPRPRPSQINVVEIATLRIKGGS